jgi:hypothetical protein
MPGVYMAHDPVIGQMFIIGEDHSALRLTVCRALVAAAKFRAEKPPGWPPLPLRREDIEAALEADDDIRRNVVGHFGSSLWSEGWGPEHPSFRPFVSGLMFDEHTPIEIRSDPELRREFPPVKLAGMTGGWSTWRSPETLTMHRKMRRMCAAHDAARAAERIGP